MNITDNLIRIKEGKDNIIKSLKNKGVEISENTLINEIPTIIDNAEIGGGGDTPSVPTELVQKYEGASVFRINVPNDNYEFAINLCNNASTATYDVDWGDGSLESGLTTDEQHHTYNKSGTYDVNVYNLSKEITLGGSTTISSIINTTVYYLFNNTHNDYWLGNKYKYQKDNIVTNILIGDKITSIGSSAFNSCTSLQSIVISEGVTKIDSSAFSNCFSLQSIVIPEGVTSIGSNAFSACSSLQSIVIPNSVTSINERTFYDCFSLQSIVIPNSVTSIGSYTFNSCTSLQSVVIPEGVTKIGSNAFSACSSLQSIVIPNSVTSIGNYAFQNCFSLQSIVIPEGVTSIGSNAFSACSSLQSVVIPEGVTKIDSNAFSGCSSLQSVVIPEGVTSIASSTFSGCSSLQSITINSETAPTIQTNSFPTSFKYTKKYLYIHKDADIETYTSGNWKTYLIDKGWELRYIEEYEKTPTTLKLKTTNNFFHNLQTIGQAKLIDYELIDNEYIYNFDDKITELVQYTFYNKILEEIELPEGLEIIGTYAFQSYTSLQSIVIPNSVTSIGSSAFYYCDNLHTITCKAMTAPTIQSNTFQFIASSVPSGTPKVLRIPINSSGYEETTSEWYKQLIPKGYKVEYIVPNTLNYTSYSGDIVTPYAKSFEGKNEIVSNVYENGIGTVTFKEGLTEIYDDMYNTDLVGELRSIEIPNTITRIGDYSFRSQYLTALNVPDSVTYIGDSAFNGCTKLTEITLGNSVETIGQWAFSGCTQVATITSMAMVAPSTNQSFLSVGLNVSGDKILRVPQGAEGYDTWLSQLNGFTIEYI
jgi:hypothetical protein